MKHIYKKKNFRENNTFNRKEEVLGFRCHLNWESPENILLPFKLYDKLNLDILQNSLPIQRWNISVQTMETKGFF